MLPIIQLFQPSNYNYRSTIEQRHDTIFYGISPVKLLELEWGRNGFRSGFNAPLQDKTDTPYQRIK